MVIMGLSEREQQLLDEMERGLYQSEADLMQAGSGSSRRLSLRSLVLGILLGLVGVGLLIGGVASQQLWLGLIGFAVMLGGAVLAFTRTEADGDLLDDAGDPQRRRSADRESLSDRMGRRWDERMEGER